MPIKFTVVKLGESPKTVEFSEGGPVKVSEILGLAEMAASGYQVRYEGEIVTPGTAITESGSVTLVPKLKSGR